MFQNGHDDKIQQPTKVFAKAGLDVVIFGCSSLSASVSAGRE